MQPADLTLQSFAAYPSRARALATQHHALLQSLPLALLPILLRDLSAYDFKLPAEQRETETQLTFLAAPPANQAIAGFRPFNPAPEIAATDWVNDPSGFLEKLTAWLWSTQQMDRFRAQADTYTAAVKAAYPDALPTVPRLAVVVIGAETPKTSAPLFRKLRPHGVYFNALQPTGGLQAILTSAAQRTPANDPQLRHWYIDGAATPAPPHLTTVSYATLERPRAQLLAHIQSAIATGTMGPEQLRSLLARIKPTEIGLDNTPLSHFQLSLLTEGSGTQIFATTFVQWAARECVRRAQPETLVVRYTPRQQAQTMNAMLTGAAPTGPDLEGSLIDADMGAYYTWLNLRRLTGSTDLRFLAWFEGHRQALAIGPNLPAGTTSDSPLTLAKILTLMA